MTRMSPVFSRALALMLLLGLLCGGYLFIVSPIVERHAFLNQAIIDNTELLRRYVALSGSKKALAEQLEKLQNQGPASGSFLAGGSESLVGAQLQDRMKRIVEESGGRLTSVQILPGQQEAGFRRITIRARINGSVEAVQQILHTLENPPPLLIVKSLDVRSQQIRRRKGDTSAAPIILNVNIDVSGYMRGKAS